MSGGTATRDVGAIAAAVRGLASCTSLLLTLILAVAACGGPSTCSHAPVLIGGAVPSARAAADPCAGQAQEHVVTWFTRGGVRYPLRCGKRDPGGFAYLHIRYDESGHGDPLNDVTFASEIQGTLDHGVEALVGGGTWRYTVRYGDDKSACFNGAWGFRVVLAKSPNGADGHPAGIITALYYSQQPERYP